MDIYAVLNVSEELHLSANEALVFLNIIARLNRRFWQPVAIRQEVAGRGMHRETFFSVRKRLVEIGALTYSPGQWKTAPPIYGLGPRFNNNKPLAGKEMRNPKDLKKLVIEIDQQYPEFSALCARHKWDKAIEVLKAGHPELQLNEWAVDSIGDPANRKEAHEMFVKLHNKKGGQVVVTPKLAAPDGPWTSFYLFVDMWLLSYPKRASKASVKAAVKEFITDKDQWTPAQVKDLQDKIETHTRAYVASFDDDIKYMVSPANYFAAEKWTEKVPVKYDKTDMNYKTAGAPVRPNMPAVLMIKAN